MHAFFTTPSILSKFWTCFFATTLIASVFALNACAPKNETIPVEWALSGEAQESYITLLLNQSIRNNDLDGVQEAARLIIQAPPIKQRSADIAAWLLITKEHELARDVLLSALVAFPRDLGLCLLLAEAYLELNQTQKALEYVQDFAKRNPKHPQIQQELAVLNLKAGNIDASLVLFAALETPEKTSFIRYFYAQALKAKKRYSEAAIQLQKALDSSPEFIEARLELALIFELQGKLKQAAQSYDTLLTLETDIQEPWLRATQFYIRHGQAKKALKIAQSVPSAYAFQLTTASLMIEADALAEAAELVAMLAKEYPNEPDLIFFQAALAFQYEKNTDKALAYLAVLPTDSRFYKQAINLHAHLLASDNRIFEAVDIAQMAHQNMPDSKELTQLAVDMLIIAKKDTEAFTLLEQAREQWPQDSSWVYTSASLYFTRNELQKAFDFMEQVILINPNHYQALNYVGYTLADENRDLPRAITLLTQAVALAPNEAHIVDSLAWAEFKSGAITKALATIRRAIQLPNVAEPSIWEHYGDIAYAAGNKDEAMTAWRKALTFNPANALHLQEKLTRP